MTTTSEKNLHNRNYRCNFAQTHRTIQMKDNTQNMTIQDVTLKGTLMNILLMALKFAAAILGTSAAMLADAIHSLSDLLTDIIVMLYVKLNKNGEKGINKFGRHSFENVAIIIVGIVILVVGFSICYSGVRTTIRAFQGEVLPRPGYIALVAAVVSIILKEWTYRFTIKSARKTKSYILSANAWHHRSDAISSIGTTIGIACAIFLGVRWRILDPITSVIVSVFVMSIAFHLLSDAIRNLFWYRIPEQIEEEIERQALKEEPVRRVNGIFVRRIGPDLLVRMHISVDESMTVGEAHNHVLNIEQRVKQQYGANTNIGIFIDPYQ